jgi:hypothetical protein
MEIKKGQSEQNIVKCFWPSGYMLFAVRGGVNRAGIRASGERGS